MKYESNYYKLYTFQIKSLSLQILHEDFKITLAGLFTIDISLAYVVSWFCCYTVLELKPHTFKFRINVKFKRKFIILISVHQTIMVEDLTVSTKLFSLMYMAHFIPQQEKMVAGESQGFWSPLYRPI